ncbi:MAG: hypothetical protein NT090_26955 [Acidobacteria bacterium]|nr:hypothetical protein [Acidobacteriota bacterium]
MPASWGLRASARKGPPRDRRGKFSGGGGKVRSESGFGCNSGDTEFRCLTSDPGRYRWKGRRLSERNGAMDGFDHVQLVTEQKRRRTRLRLAKIAG